MPRPQKCTVEYFSHDALASEGKTLSILFNHFGHEGLSAWWLLLERISVTANHAITIKNHEDVEFLSAKMHFQPARLTQILDKMADLGAIDPKLYHEGIIWSQNFVDRLQSVYAKRKQNLPSKPLSTAVMPVSAAETGLSLPETPQTKLKETKLKETKGERDTLTRRDDEKDVKDVFGEFKNVKLLKDEHAKLVERLGRERAEDLIERLSCYMKSRRKTYRSHYATLLNWARDDAAKLQPGMRTSEVGQNQARKERHSAEKKGATLGEVGRHSQTDERAAEELKRAWEESGG